MKAVILATAALVAGTAARALPPAQFTAQSFTDNGLYGGTSQSIAGPGTAASSITNPEGFVRGSVTLSGFQRVSAEGDGSGYRNQGIELGGATYYFGVVGPAAVDVPLIFTGSAGVWASGGSSVGVYETYGSNGGTYSNFGPIGCNGSGGCGSFTYTQHYHLLAGTTTTAGDVGFTTLHIYLIAQEGRANGFIDPFITIDPTFADAARYHIDFTAGTGNPGGVPEPATWALMLTGIALAGGAMRSARARLPQRVAA